jgi:hypothetical protein
MLENEIMFPIEYTRTVLQDILERRFLSVAPRVKDSFNTVSLSIRYTIILNIEQLVTIWNGIRIDPALVDFILDVTREFLLRGFDPGGYSYQTCVNQLGENHKLMVSGASAIDVDLINSTADGNTYKILLENNPWFVMLCIAETLITPGTNDE